MKRFAILALVMEFGMKMRFATIMLICVIIGAARENGPMRPL